MVTPVQIDEQTKKKIYEDLAEALIAGLEKGLIPEQDSQDSSAFILDNLDAIQTREELIRFLETLCRRWDIYREVYLEVKKGELLDSIQSELTQLSQ